MSWKFGPEQISAISTTFEIADEPRMAIRLTRVGEFKVFAYFFLSLSCPAGAGVGTGADAAWCGAVFAVG